MINKRIKGIVTIVLIIIILLLTLGYLSYPICEGITAQEIKDEANAATDAKIQATKPQSIIKPFKYTVTITDTKEYPVKILTAQEKLMKERMKTPDDDSEKKFIEKYPNSTYLITSVSEEAPTKSVVPVEFKLNTTTPVVLPTETSIFNNFYAIAPKYGSKFPEKFSLNLTNMADENGGVSVFLWGDITNATSIPKNNVIGIDNILSTPYNVLSTPCNKNIFSVKDASGNDAPQLLVGGVNIGQNALNIYGQGSLYNRQNNVIGAVDASTNITRLNCSNSKDITGMLIFMGHPSK